MNTETINTQLYEKMFAEQERYRDGCCTSLPEEILNHAYEYAIVKIFLWHWNPEI